MKLLSLKITPQRIIITILGIKMSFKRNLIVLKNVFKTKYDKTMLLMYLLEPFVNTIDCHHSNLTEAYTAAEVWSELGYNVDVSNYQIPKVDFDYSKYDAIYGIKLSDKKLLATPNVKKILYPVCQAPKLENNEAIVRAMDFYKKTNSRAFISSILPDGYQHAFMDANIILGNEVVKSTYDIEGLELNNYSLDGFYFDIYDIDVENKDFSEAKKHFLWWGSRCAIHKGLDIVLDIFKQRPDLTLHICGFKDQEVDFSKCYKKELNNEYPNIINHGFVYLKSDLFKELMDKCCAVISPSISEGGAIGIINVMANGGLIPIISKSSGLDVDKYGYMFNKNTIEDVSNALDNFNKLSAEEIKNLSTQVKNESREKYNLARYKTRLKEILTKVLS